MKKYKQKWRKEIGNRSPIYKLLYHESAYKVKF
nr:MAG TPA: hypothetical protein [Caudoviricetes sp.]